MVDVEAPPWALTMLSTPSAQAKRVLREDFMVSGDDILVRERVMVQLKKRLASCSFAKSMNIKGILLCLPML